MNGLVCALAVLGVFCLVIAIALATDKPTPPVEPFVEQYDVDAAHRADVAARFAVKP